MDVAFPTRRRGTRAREQCARPPRPERASGCGRLDRVPRAREHGAHVRQAPPARWADGTAPQPCPCVVVLINQVSTRANKVLGSSGLVPALGEAWAHMCNMQVSLEWRDGVRLAAHASPPTPRRPLQRWRAREAPFAVTADGIRSADPSSKLLAPPRPVEAALAPLQLQRWPDAAAAPCADGRLQPYRAAVAHGTKQVHKQASSSCSAVENLQPQQLARSVFFLDCLRVAD